MLLMAAILLVCLKTNGQKFEAGASQAAVNPDIPSFIAGHSQNRTFNALHDSLFVKVVVVGDGKKKLAIITYDCIGMLYPHLESIRKRMTAMGSNVFIDNIIMSSTHTHAGPDVVGLWGPDLMHSGVDKKYMQKVVDITIKQILNALRNMEPVTAVFGTAAHNFTWVHNISEPDELDRSVTSIMFRNKKGKSVATMTNFACHPTFLDAVHTSISADYPAGFYQAMDQEYGGINLFLQGSIGGWVQPEGERQTFERAYYRGKELAATTIAMLTRPSKIKGNDLTFASSIIDLPVNNTGFIQLSKAGVIDRNIDTTVKTEIAWFTIGNAVFATHPGETVPAMSIATKELMHTDGPKFVLGLSMDALGYILKPYFFDQSRKIPHAEYLCGMSLGPETSRHVMETLKMLSRKNKH